MCIDMEKHNAAASSGEAYRGDSSRKCSLLSKRGENLTDSLLFWFYTI